MTDGKDGTNRDERIAAYLDRQMSNETMAVFEAEMEQDPTLADEVARLMENDALLRSAFDAPLHEAADDAVIARMGLASPPVLAANDNAPFLRKWRWPLGSALAASVALAFFMQAKPGSRTDAQFASAMDSLMSRQTAQLDGGATLTPVLSFRAEDGRYCREYVVSGGEDAGSGIACRDNDGWMVEAQIKASARIADPSRIETASGADEAALAEAYTRLGASDPLDAQKEKQAIADSWKKNAK